MKNLIIFIFFFPFLSTAQNLLFLQDNVSGQKEFVQKNNLDTYIIINQGQFVTNDLLDEDKLEKEINKRFPIASSNGYAVLDWEGKAMAALVQQNDRSQLELYIEQFIKALQIAKRLRPNVKWAFYNVPNRFLSNISNSFKEKNYRLADIIKCQDFLAPSMYILDPSSDTKISNLKIIRSNIKLTLEMGLKYNKPVYPFIWQRVHPNNKMYNEQLVPISYFKDYIGEIMNTSFNGTKVSGLIWWQCENYYYLTRSKSKVYAREYANLKDRNRYQKDMFQQYYNSIKKYLNK